MNTLPVDLEISDHAIDRYIERWGPTLDRDQAKLVVAIHVRQATFVAQECPGVRIYRDGRVHLVLDHTTIPWTVKTVLPPGTVWRDKR